MSRGGECNVMYVIGSRGETGFLTAVGRQRPRQTDPSWSRASITGLIQCLFGCLFVCLFVDFGIEERVKTKGVCLGFVAWNLGYGIFKLYLHGI